MSDAQAFELLGHASTLIFDFDGVILDSNHIKEEGFRQLFIEYGEDKAQQIVQYHRDNGGLSRYHKIRYFFTEVLGRSVPDEEVERLANRFSAITMGLLKDRTLRIEDTLGYIESVHQKKSVFIASASDEKDLLALCRYHGIEEWFKGIYGSPKSKESIVNDILEKGRAVSDCVLIGDSFNDLNAAQANGVAFIGYNNPALSHNHPYIRCFSEANVQADDPA